MRPCLNSARMSSLYREEWNLRMSTSVLVLCFRSANGSKFMYFVPIQCWVLLLGWKLIGWVEGVIDSQEVILLVYLELRVGLNTMGVLRTESTRNATQDLPPIIRFLLLRCVLQLSLRIDAGSLPWWASTSICRFMSFWCLDV